MERHDVLVRNLVESGVHLCFQCRELFDVGGSILFISVCVGRIGFLQLIGNVAHLCDSIGDAQPDVRVVALVVVDQLDAARRIDDLHFLLCARHLVHEVLHAGTVDDKSIGVFECLHILGHELVVVQTSRLRLRHVGDLNAVHSIRDVDGRQIHGIERRDDAERFLRFLLRRLLRSAAAEERCREEDEQQG